MTKNISYVFVLLLALFTSCIAHTQEYGTMHPVYFYPGIGLGTIIAVAISWSRNKSVLWAIIHGILGWLYIIYAIIVREK